ncbi:MAG: hypothetical protein ACRD6X_19900, partial [Pyrinomonadaceae bacterium]
VLGQNISKNDCSQSDPMVGAIDISGRIRNASAEINFFVNALKQCEGNVGYVLYTSGKGKLRQRNLKYVARIKKQLTCSYGIDSKRLFFVDRGAKGQKEITFYSLPFGSEFINR